MTDADVRLETQIDQATLELQTGRTREQRREAFRRLQVLVAQRSTARVEQMERERGLR